MPAWKRRIVVVDDETLVVTLIAELLVRHSFDVRTAQSAAEARQVISAFDPDAALVDIHLGTDPSGLHLGHVLRQAHPHMGIIFSSRFTDPTVAGLREVDIPEGFGFIAKEHISDSTVSLDALNSALRGKVVIGQHDSVVDLGMGVDASSTGGLGSAILDEACGEWELINTDDGARLTAVLATSGTSEGARQTQMQAESVVDLPHPGHSLAAVNGASGRGF